MRTSMPLRIVSYATTPVAGVPAILARCISARTSHTARCVWAQNGYGNGVIFEGDIQWKQSPAEAEAALAERGRGDRAQWQSRATPPLAARGQSRHHDGTQLHVERGPTVGARLTPGSW